MIRVLLVDDQPLVRAGLRVLVDAEPGVQVVGEAGDGDHALALARELVPDVVLMDIRMPGTDGIEATRRIGTDPALREVRVLVVTTFGDDENVLAALRAGASGFVLKDAEPDELMRAIHAVAGGDQVLDPAATRALIATLVGGATEDRPRPAFLDRLTPRELEVVGLVALGLTNDEIGSRLGISGATARTHVSRSMLKVDARDRVQLVVLAHRWDLVAPA